MKKYLIILFLIIWVLFETQIFSYNNEIIWDIKCSEINNINRYKNLSWNIIDKINLIWDKLDNKYKYKNKIIKIKIYDLYVEILNKHLKKSNYSNIQKEVLLRIWDYFACKRENVYSYKNKDILNNAVSVKKYGAKWDGVTDDTFAIQNAINSELKLYFPAGKYMISNSIYIRSNTTLISENAIIYVTQEYPVYGPLRPGFFFKDSVKNVDMLGNWIFEWNSYKSAFKKDTSHPDDTYAQWILIKTNCSDIYIESLEWYNFTAWVIEIWTYNWALPSHDIVIDRIKAYNCWNANIAITMWTNIHFKDVETYWCLSNPNYAQIWLDIEPDDKKILKNIQIDNLVTYKNEIWFQILNDNKNQTWITVNKIHSYENIDNWMNLINTFDFIWNNIDIHDNYWAGLFIEWTFKNISINSGKLYNNKNHGILAEMDSYLIKSSSENLNLWIDIYNNHGYGILLTWSDKYPVKNFNFNGKIYDDQENKTQLTGIDIKTNVLNFNINGEITNNKNSQIIK